MKTLFAVLAVVALTTPAWAVMIDFESGYTNGDLGGQGTFVLGPSSLSSILQVADGVGVDGGKGVIIGHGASTANYMTLFTGLTKTGISKFGYSWKLVDKNTEPLWGGRFDTYISHPRNVNPPFRGRNSWDAPAHFTTNVSGGAGAYTDYFSCNYVDPDPNDPIPGTPGWNTVEIWCDWANSRIKVWVNGVNDWPQSPEYNATGTPSLPDGWTAFQYPQLPGTTADFVFNPQNGTTTSIAGYLDNIWYTPEPATMALLGVGGVMALIRRRR